jgi:hypothetical protein
MASMPFKDPFKKKIPSSNIWNNNPYPATGGTSANPEKDTDESCDQLADGAALALGELNMNSSGDLVPPLQTNETIVTYDKLLEQHRFKEPAVGSEYQAELEPITGRYAGSDAPSKANMRHPIVTSLSRCLHRRAGSVLRPRPHERRCKRLDQGRHSAPLTAPLVDADYQGSRGERG